MDSRGARVARGTAAATAATLAAAVSHTLAGGVPPTVFGLLVSLIIAGMLCTLMAGRRVSLVRLATAIGTSQVLFHALFSGLGTPVVAMHAHGMVRLDQLVATHDHGSMWVAHFVAGILTLLAFRYAEGAFWGMTRLARMLLARLLGLVIPVTNSLRARLAPRPVLLAPLSAVLVTSMRDRGPPRGLAVA